MVTDRDRLHLRRALDLAAGGQGRVSPNPLVGALIVQRDQVIGEGFHAELGGLHAEAAALADARAHGADPAGATMYATLEPCAHHGRQPPCVDAIVDAGIAQPGIPQARAHGTAPRHAQGGGHPRRARRDRRRGLAVDLGRSQSPAVSPLARRGRRGLRGNRDRCRG